ncbi:MAG: hypothetical protein IKT33_00810, partial [Clostridia bacterium]|nr:hypothetical protein [Clostridia bacterium]
MKKRSLASLLIVSIVAVAAVFGVVFAFKNSGRQQDVYGSVTVTVDKPNIDLFIELVKDETTDSGFRIVDKPESFAYFTIKVGGLPKTASRRVELNKSSISNGAVKVEAVSEPEEAAMTGINNFKVTGLNAGAPKIVFTTVSGGQTISVNVNVYMTAKDMKIAEDSHFALRQGEAPLNLMSNAILNKFTFFAHPEDSGRVYSANKFPVTYRLKEEYPGVILQQGAISVTEDATCVDQYIVLQAKLPAMTGWLDIPFYVFPAAKNINIKTVDAYKAETTKEYVWDLIKNRDKYEKAIFEFALDYGKSANSDYEFKVVSADSTIVRVEHLDQYTRKLSAGQNLGEVAINVVCYPVIYIDGMPIRFDGAEDKNVQINKTFYIRLRNEFNTAGENFGVLSYALVADKNTVNAYYYEGKNSQCDYYDTFSLNTENGKVVNFDSEIEFVLDVEYPNGQKFSYGWDASKNPNSEIGLFNILQIGYWSSETNSWVMLSEKNYTANYLNTFRVSFVKSAFAHENFVVYDDLKFTLHAKSVHQLTNGSLASLALNLDSVYAIDGLEIKNLTEFDDGSKGIALVYDKENGFSSENLEVYGLVAGDSGVVD